MIPIRVAMVVSNGCAPDPRVQKEAVALAAAGYEVDIYAFDRTHELATVEQLTDRARIVRLRAPTPIPNNLVTVAAGLTWFKAAVKRRIAARPPLVVHSHDQDTCAVGRWWKARGARRCGLSRGFFVFDAHDLYWTWAVLPNPDSKWRKGLARTLRWNDERYARAADLVVTVTRGTNEHEGTAEIYERLGCRPVVVANAPSPPRATPPLPREFTVGYFGNVREPAMFSLLIEAIGGLPPALRPAIRVAGDGRARAEVQRILAEAAERLDLNVLVEGRFAAAALPRLMASCSIQYCVYPLRRGNIDRSLPVKLLESVAYGRKAIGNADTLMGDWIRSNDWGWTSSEDDAASLRRALRSAHVEYAGRGGAAPRLAPPPMWPEQARVLVDAYAALLGARRGSDAEC